MTLRTGAWYGDHPLDLDFPSGWAVTFLWPRTPPPLTDDQIAASLEFPTGPAVIRRMCRDCSRPLVIVDDLNRPTPASRVMPFLLKHFRDAGVPNGSVRILMATGTHGAPPEDALAKKVGSEAASSCRLLVHDSKRDCVRVSTTSFGTPVIVNKEVLRSDLVIGIGGIYPNHSVGFGGGSKLALGVLGFRSIQRLHYSHLGASWGSEDIGDDFRRDLDEIARIIGLKTMISLHIDADRQVVRVACGDHFAYFKDEVAFSKRAFAAPAPDNADVVISNAYPSDLSLTFVCMKGISPLQRSKAGVSRVAIASLNEGIGHHGLFPILSNPALHQCRQLAWRLSRLSPGEFARKLGARLHAGVAGRRKNQPSTAPRNPIWVYRAGNHSHSPPLRIHGLTVSDSWPELLGALRREQEGKPKVRVVVYACAPLQTLDVIETLAPSLSTTGAVSVQ
jgi:nickel-dependent lactate racemase